jgi:hypothetical protein
VVLHVHHAEHVAVDVGHERHVLDPADVPGELQLVRRVLGGAFGDAPTELDEQSSDGRPIVRNSQANANLAHNGHPQGASPHFGQPSA